MTAPVTDGLPSPTAVKIIIAGGYGVGKTTFVGAISEIPPVTTEAIQSHRSFQPDGDPAMPGKTTTTVAMDFGRVTLGDDLALYLFAMPGQERFWFMWDYLVAGAIGAVVMVDVRRFTDCFRAVDFFEHLGLPTAIAVNVFDGAPTYATEQLRTALAVAADVPIYLCDARSRESAKTVLVGLAEHAISQRRANSHPVSAASASANHRI